MIGMTRSMAKELGEWNITAHLFMPGAVETEVERPSVSGAMFENLAKQQAVQRPATMDEYAGFMLFPPTKRAADAMLAAWMQNVSTTIRPTLEHLNKTLA